MLAKKEAAQRTTTDIVLLPLSKVNIFVGLLSKAPRPLTLNGTLCVYIDDKWINTMPYKILFWHIVKLGACFKFPNYLFLPGSDLYYPF